jgi:multidrug efflux pump
VDKARPELPPDAEDPILTEINFSEFPIMLVNLHGEADLLQLKGLAEDIQDELETVPGVLDVTLSGGVEREVRVMVDPDKLKYYGLSLNEVTGALQREHVNLPGGSIDVGSLKYLVRVDGEFKDSRPL